MSQRLSLGELADAFERLRDGDVFRQVLVFDPARQTLSLNDFSR
jgi:hypothetical protein